MRITVNFAVFIRSLDSGSSPARTTIWNAMQHNCECWTTEQEVWDVIVADYSEKAAKAQATADLIRQQAAAVAGPGGAQEQT